MNDLTDSRSNERDGDDDLRRLFKRERCPERPLDTDTLLNLADPDRLLEQSIRNPGKTGARVKVSAKDSPQPPAERKLYRHQGIYSAGRLAAMASLTAAVSLLGWFAWQTSGRIALADVQRALAEARSIHMIIHLNVNAASDPVKKELWYQAGAGWAVEERASSACDNGTYRWQWGPDPATHPTRSKSRLNNGRIADARQLAKSVGIVFDEFSDKAVRNREKDRTVGGEPCRAFELPLGPSVLTASHVEAVRTTRTAKTVFLLDKRDRIRYCENQVLLDGSWVTYRKAEVAYDVEIDPDRFTPTFNSNVVVYDSIDLVTKRDQEEQPVDPIIARLSKGIEKRQQGYHDLMFTYDTTTNVKRSPEAAAKERNDWLTNGPLTTSNVLKIMSPLKEKDDRPWRVWIRSLPHSGGHQLVDRFAAFDQDKFACFISNSDPLKRNQGIIRPREDIEWWERNAFDSSFLFMQINGTSRVWELHGGTRNHRLECYHVVGQEQLEGRTVYNLYYSWPAFGMEYFVRVSGEPDYMLLRWEAKELEGQKRTLLLHETTSTKQFQGVVYPAAGRHREVAVGETPDVTYEFKVTSVRQLEENDRKRWIPEWPPHTGVADQISGLNINIPSTILDNPSDDQEGHK